MQLKLKAIRDHILGRCEFEIADTLAVMQAVESKAVRNRDAIRRLEHDFQTALKSLTDQRDAIRAGCLHWQTTTHTDPCEGQFEVCDFCGLTL